MHCCHCHHSLNCLWRLEQQESWLWVLAGRIHNHHHSLLLAQVHWTPQHHHWGLHHQDVDEEQHGDLPCGRGDPRHADTRATNKRVLDIIVERAAVITTYQCCCQVSTAGDSCARHELGWDNNGSGNNCFTGCFYVTDCCLIIIIILSPLLCGHHHDSCCWVKSPVYYFTSGTRRKKIALRENGLKQLFLLIIGYCLFIYHFNHCILHCLIRLHEENHWLEE